jgi:hypothetical protein
MVEALGPCLVVARRQPGRSLCPDGALVPAWRRRLRSRGLIVATACTGRGAWAWLCVSPRTVLPLQERTRGLTIGPRSADQFSERATRAQARGALRNSMGAVDGGPGRNTKCKTPG